MPPTNNDEAQINYRGTYADTAKNFRTALKDIASHVWDFKKQVAQMPKANNSDRHELDGEMIANVMLAYRHLEDASMRLGKVIQAAGDGTSIYDSTASAPSHDSNAPSGTGPTQ